MAKADKPNILVIWGDDIGIWNLSCYSGGMMGYRTPNIDRIANEGMRFTDSYGEQSCTAGRAAFITGQSVFRTGLSKVGLPGAPVGIQAEDPTIAELLKPLGYATGQFGKNHFGDQNRFLPTVHGFDEFFGNLYHLNAEEDPEDEDYPKDPKFKEKFGPRGVLRCRATDKDDKTEQPRWGRVGKQKIEDTGPLTRKRMETCDDEFVAAAKDFIKRQHDAGKPFFLWLNTTHMHCRTHTKPKSRGQAGEHQSFYHDTMVDHDKNVGEMLDYLDELGIADNTFVMYSTDNGPHMNTWPDGAMTPFRSEKNTNWEGAFRVPLPGALARQDPGGLRLQRDRPAPRLAADLPGHGGRARHRREAEEGPQGRRQDLQGAHRRLQPAGVPDQEGRQEPAPGLHLLQRRRRSGGDPLRQLEGRLHGAALPGDAAGLGRAVHRAADTQALQPADRPLRAGRHHLQHLLGLVHVQGLHDHGGAGARHASSWRRSRSSRRARRRRASPSIRRWRRWRRRSPAPGTDAGDRLGGEPALAAPVPGWGSTEKALRPRPMSESDTHAIEYKP